MTRPKRLTNAVQNGHANGSETPAPLTISQWKTAQMARGGLERLCSLIDAEKAANSTTHAWISLATPEQIKAQWTTLQTLGADATSLPLYRVPFAAKDNIDAKGFLTTAACPTFHSEPAASDATVIAMLKAAGAILVGKTNLDQFATGLVGTRSPHGAVPNTFGPTRISGGSSSGSAAAVARGVVPFSLGTDTAGSGRVPAGFNNIVGLEPTRGALGTYGVVPACKTLDCVSIFSLTAADAETVLSVAEGYDPRYSFSRARSHPSIDPINRFGVSPDLKRPSLAICASPVWFGSEDNCLAYDKALSKARVLGWSLVPVDFDLLFRLAQFLYHGPWVAERYEAIRDFIERASPEEMDPAVGKITTKAQSLSAADVFAGEYARQELSRQVELAFAQFDGLFVPTTPTFPTLEHVSKRPVQENSLLGTYTSFVNLLDWSAISIPAGFRIDRLPFGVTLISSRWQEACLVSWARCWSGDEKRILGATGVRAREPCILSSSVPANHAPVAIFGAHLSGFPLNKDVVFHGGKLSRRTRTSSSYRLYTISPECGPARPGLERVPAGQAGAEIEVQVWNLPKPSLADFISTIFSPLAVGSVELHDGSWVQGLVCEPYGLAGAVDITSHGGWRAYNDFLQKHAEPLTNGIHKRAISKVLVANRGEIAVRIIETVQRMGLEAIAIYSAIDADAAHVSKADVSLKLQGSSVSETYMDISQILALAAQSTADAIIPGYGFLSENAEFAASVEERGMVWVGPTPQQMIDLGLKHRSRAIALEASVPIIPGCDALLTSLEEALEEGRRIGFPLMLKGTAGGGGIGLSYCEDFESLATAFESVQRQASTNFGNGGVFMERFIPRARHVEVQILGDGKGRVITAGERDCSLQRRHQKIIEESPAIMIPTSVREEMRSAAVRLASLVNYRSVGTVEFAFDVDTGSFYLLEVNTRLQVEHPVTESVTGLDLVECMLSIADGRASLLFESTPQVSGVSIEARVYAESPLQNFRPCSGQITTLRFPSSLRVDTWIKSETEITTSFDPLVAKLIASGADRKEAIENLANGLAATRIEGVQTNLEYLRQITCSALFESGTYTTVSLDDFSFTSSSFEVLEPGTLTTVQDYPGRTGYWDIGVPPSGPMDSYSFRIANQITGNPPGAAGLECTLKGPSLKFHCKAIIAVSGGVAPVMVDGMPVSVSLAIVVEAGQVVSIGNIERGYRVYLAIRGGIQVPVAMGSRATFEVGKLGGFCGRKLQKSDIVAIESLADTFVRQASQVALSLPILSQPNTLWTTRVIPGPHSVPDYFTPESIRSLYLCDWTVHHNSNRLGVRLKGPQPAWSRKSGGEAGLHPSNIHDAPYSIGSVSFTGDEAVVLGCDGPSLGGFVVLCVVASADMWKLGQVRPGDAMRFVPTSVEEAIELEMKTEHSIETLSPFPAYEETSADQVTVTQRLENLSPVVGIIEPDAQRITVRQAGDRALLLEYGNSAAFSLRHNFGISAFCQQHQKTPIAGVEELTPGVFSLHVAYQGGLSPGVMMERLIQHVRSYKVPSRIPSRKVRLPIVIDDAATRAAIDRYAATIRRDAPWLPSNIGFLEKLNGIQDISEVLGTAEFVVLGLGDVFMGSPCAIPLDPRHRLFGAKYNPSRSFTPRGAVGIGGQYMCIYAADSPGGYQLVGRTVEIWDRGFAHTEQREKPWLFRLFDRISFYPVGEASLCHTPREDLVQISDGMLDLVEYEAWLEKNKQDIIATASRQAKAIADAPFLDELLRPYHVDSRVNNHASSLDGLNVGGMRIKATMPGRCYKVMVKEEASVKKNDVLVSLTIKIR
ncbi:hypothetical protein F66182_8663 [Fusarium sp. NRRL 66182]|nr:hypothetical protein F66182_8663 [Fusarium sp. NRRL 66182]